MELTEAKLKGWEQQEITIKDSPSTQVDGTLPAILFPDRFSFHIPKRKTVLHRPDFFSPLFNEVVIYNGLVYCSGKIGLNLGTSKLVGDDVGK